MILSSTYLPPAWYIHKIQKSDVLQLDLHEHFVKQTIRNRCHILSPNGVQTLIIPVVHQNRTNTAMKDIRIANDRQWQRQHWRSLNACYRRSAFFEFYMDDFAPFYHREYEFLHDLNSGLLRLVLDALKIRRDSIYTDKYEKPDKVIENDFRLLCDAGLPDGNAYHKKYPQVFTYKNGFTPGLSIIDILFNTGPSSENYLQ